MDNENTNDTNWQECHNALAKEYQRLSNEYFLKQKEYDALVEEFSALGRESSMYLSDNLKFKRQINALKTALKSVMPEPLIEKLLEDVN